MLPKLLLISLLSLLIIASILIFPQVRISKVELETPEELKFEKPKIVEEKITKLAEKEIKIITLYDNYQSNPQLKTGWGFSCLVKTGKQNILFDTGADSETLLFNMEKMGIKPKEINIIVLSHIHGDHVGGLEGVLRINSNLVVFIPESFGESFKNKIESYGAKVIEVKEPIEILGDVYSTGELGAGIKEQSLVINTTKGLIVITGCAHPGVVNIIRKAKETFPKESVYLVLGGFHLSGASDSELKEIIKDFRNLGVEKAAPCHCSGDRCRQLFKEEYKDDFIESGVGKIIDI